VFASDERELMYGLFQVACSIENGLWWNVSVEMLIVVLGEADGAELTFSLAYGHRSIGKVVGTAEFDQGDGLAKLVAHGPIKIKSIFL
jgi:hypothetical protein